MRLLALALVAVPFAAVAEDITVTADGATTGPAYVGRASCPGKTISFQWTPGPNVPAGSTYNLIAARSLSTCSADPATLTSPDVLIASTTDTSKALSASSFILVAGADGGDSGATCDSIDRSSAAPLNTVFCVQVRTVGLTTTTQIGHFDISFANRDPTAPGKPTIEPGSKHLRVSWAAGNASEKIESYDVHVYEQGADAGTSPAEHVTSTTSADVQQTDAKEELVDDTKTYEVYVVAKDLYGNVSPPSETSEGKPTYVADFYNHYRDEGGGAAGGQGCSTGAGAAWLAALAAGVALLARRRKGSAALVLALALPFAAQAQAVKKYERPPRKWLFALKIDRYHPGVDNEPGLRGTPYYDIFGDRTPLRWQVEADWEVAHPFGTLLLGVTAGYWQNIGKGIKPVTNEASGDTTLLDVIPFGAVATYRFDWLADRYRWFPLIPYAQAGLSRALWASFSGRGSVSRRDNPDDSGRGSGWSYGFTTAVGVAFNLDAIDPALSHEAYNDMGIQRSSVFAEYGWTRLDNFGKYTSLGLNDRALRFGVALEF